MPKKPPHKRIGYFLRTFKTILGVILVWRGIWYALDAVDRWFFGASPFWTALLGVVIGVVILYLPDRTLKEIENFSVDRLK